MENLRRYLSDNVSVYYSDDGNIRNESFDFLSNAIDFALLNSKDNNSLHIIYVNHVQSYHVKDGYLTRGWDIGYIFFKIFC